MILTVPLRPERILGQDLPVMEEEQLNKLERWDSSFWKREVSGEIFSRYANTSYEGMAREPDSSWCYSLTEQERKK